MFIINNRNSTTSPILSKVLTLTATGSVSKYGNQVEFEKLNLIVFQVSADTAKVSNYVLQNDAKDTLFIIGCNTNTLPYDNITDVSRIHNFSSIVVIRVTQQ